MEKRILRAIKSIRDQNGNSLIEVMIASVILTVSMLGVAGFYTYSMKHFADSKYLTQATTITTQRIAKLKQTRLALIGNGQEDNTVDNMAYHTVWTATDDPTGLQLKKISVTTNWTANGKPHTVNIITMTTGMPDQ